METRHRTAGRALRAAAIFAWLVLIALAAMHRRDFTLDAILHYTPENPLPAFLALMALFALKSLSVVFYAGLLYAAGGVLFPLPVALLAGVCGTLVMAAVPYLLARGVGAARADELREKHPRLRRFEQIRSRSPFAFVVALRCVNVINFDLGSMYCGAARVPPLTFLAASVIGKAADLAVWSVMGASIEERDPVPLLVALVVDLALAGAAALWVGKGEARRVSPFFRFLKGLARLLYPKYAVVGAEHLPDGACVVVGNHAKTNGPVACELYFPGERYIWCAGEMMHKGEVADYAFRDFWGRKPRAVRWFYRLLSHLVVPLALCVFRNAGVIGVYHDNRVIRTFRESVEKLRLGARIIIFPEHDAPHNHVVCDFQDRFIDLARLYYKKTGAALPFVPLYVAPRLKALYLGEPIWFDPDAPLEQERRRVCDALMDAVTGIAVSLPPHTVVPYPNVPKRDYPTNVPKEAAP
ncbi:MAG: TVP38/TMEM64 family protein [Oscillospiraceae bacterium]|nr:TVP38/TMEM64 family protein [Oscillospiraceae bacterium]